MDYCVWVLDPEAVGAAGVFVVGEMEVGGEGVEDLAGVGEVGF